MRPGRAAALLMLAAIPAALAAQGAKAKESAATTWTLRGNRGSYCIWYLADPAIAPDLVPRGTTLTPAGKGDGLHPMVARYVQDEPRFAQWIPGVVCLAFYDSVLTGSRVVAHGKPDRPVLIVMSGIAAHNAHGADGAEYYLLSLMSDASSVRGAGNDLGVDFNGVKWSSRIRMEGQDPDVTVNLDGADLLWSGHPIGQGDVGTTRTVSFGYGGRRKTAWLIRFEPAPASTHLTVGSLAIVGKGALAKALKSSPLRAVGPEDVGGTATLTFLDETHR